MITVSARVKTVPCAARARCCGRPTREVRTGNRGAVVGVIREQDAEEAVRPPRPVTVLPVREEPRLFGEQVSWPQCAISMIWFSVNS
ncbi:hypothetical protein ACFV0T_32985 [Streptomyces sp. NPDC059582]|uniref:hypothetical protein n=1 Tax=Streptomyces sp. NPDC059582 TaxID=3346875 RepID=UPI00369CEEA6